MIYRQGQGLSASTFANPLVMFQLLTSIRMVQNKLILNLLLLQVLSSEVSYNNQAAIVGHLRCTDFDRNDRPIFSLQHVCEAQGLALEKLLQLLLNVVCFCIDIGVLQMQLEQFLFG